MERTVRVVIVDDSKLAREGLTAVLATCSGVEVVGEAENGCMALPLIERAQPSVVLADISMPAMDGLALTQLIKERFPHIRIVALTMYSAYKASALAAGADAFLTKGCPTEDLLKALLEDDQ